MCGLTFWRHKLARSAVWAFVASMTVVVADEGRAQPAVTYLSQNWSAADRDAVYTTSQGSRIMPFAWFQGLKHAGGQPLLADGLARYGYLANPRSSTNPQGLPVGFTLHIRAGQPYIGMTCAACHTRQIEVGGQFYRIDGGPAIVDFEARCAMSNPRSGMCSRTPTHRRLSMRSRRQFSGREIRRKRGRRSGSKSRSSSPDMTRSFAARCPKRTGDWRGSMPSA